MVDPVIADYIGTPSATCDAQLPPHVWGNCMLASAFKGCRDQLPQIVAKVEAPSRRAIYFDPARNRLHFTSASGHRRLGFINPLQYANARQCLERYHSTSVSPIASLSTKMAGMGIFPISHRSQEALEVALQVMDWAVLLAVITPGGALAAGARVLLPRLAASAATFLGRHAVLRGIATLTQAPGWAKAAAVVGAHARRDPETFFGADLAAVFQEWYGDDKWPVTAPVTALILGGGAVVGRLPGGSYLLETLFSVGTGLHQRERMALSRQKAALPAAAISERAQLDAELKQKSAVSSVILGFSGSAALMHGIDWGRILCLVDDVMPTIAGSLNAHPAAVH